MITIHNVETGQITVRELNEAELSQLTEDRAIGLAKQTAQATADTARTAAVAKLAKLGLTVDDLQALGL